MDTSLLKDAIYKVVRMALIVAGSFGVGYASQVRESELQEAVYGLVTLVGIILSWVNWAKKRKTSSGAGS